VVLNGTSGTYVSLPGNLLAGLSNVTLEAWVTNAVSPDNVALFSFDDGLQDGVGGGYLRYVLHDQSNGRNFLELASGSVSPFAASWENFNSLVAVMTAVRARSAPITDKPRSLLK